MPPPAQMGRPSATSGLGVRALARVPGVQAGPASPWRSVTLQLGRLEGVGLTSPCPPQNLRSVLEGEVLAAGQGLGEREERWVTRRA